MAASIMGEWFCQSHHPHPDLDSVLGLLLGFLYMVIIAGSTRSLQGRSANTQERSLFQHPPSRQPQLSFCLLVYIKSNWLLIWFAMYSPVGLSSYFSVLIFNCWGIFVHMLSTSPLFSSCCISLMLYLIVLWSAYILWIDYASRCLLKSAFILW